MRFSNIPRKIICFFKLQLAKYKVIYKKKAPILGALLTLIISRGYCLTNLNWR